MKGSDACDGCVSADKYLSTKRDKQRYPVYNKIDINSKEGKILAKKYNVNRIPYIQKCRIKRDGTRGKCTSVVGWEESRWK